ncbi:MAG: hypothetical protein JXN60_05230, partial [Lentisphaerae bacterium]|nr:hypothetical protein [Lentisphaerota bacterium]
WYVNDLTGPVTDPTGPGSGSTKAIRGGSWVTSATQLQCAPRYELDPSLRYADLGFRCASTSGGGGNAGTEGDTNANGIPDWWEMWYFGSGTGGGETFSATDDTDHDGHNNLQEYIAGTDPTKESSVFVIRGVTSTPNKTNFIIKWASVAGKLYTVERSTNLTTGFIPIATDIPATASENTYIDSVGNEGLYYYKVKVQQ